MRPIGVRAQASAGSHLGATLSPHDDRRSPPLFSPASAGEVGRYEGLRNAPG